MKYRLTKENIASFLLDTEIKLKEGNYLNPEIRAKLLLLEEILLTYREECGEDVEFEMVFHNRFGITSMALKIYCERMDYREILEDGDFIIQNLIKSVEEREIWSYRKDCNIITTTIKKRKKVPQIVWIVVGAILAYVFFELCSLLPENATEFMNSLAGDYLMPAVYSILRMIAGCLIFFSISSAIASMGNLDTFKKMISKTIVRMSLNYIAIIAVFTATFTFAFGTGIGEVKGNSKALLDLLFEMIPTDIVTPFINGNMFQITVLAMAIGILMIVLGDSTKPVRDLFDCFRHFSIIAMQAFCRILPFVVFLNVFVVCDKIGEVDLAKVGMAILVGVIATVIVAIFAGISVSIRARMGIVEFTKLSSKGTVVALSTASSSAALADTKDSLLKMGIEEEFIDLMLPLQQAFYKPFALVIIYTGVFSVSQAFNIPLSGGAVFILAFIAFILANACPPVPGGIISCLTILEAQFLLPEGSMGILILIATIMDYVGGGLSLYLIHAETLGLAKSFGKIHKESKEQTDK